MTTTIGLVDHDILESNETTTENTTTIATDDENVVATECLSTTTTVTTVTTTTATMEGDINDEILLTKRYSNEQVEENNKEIVDDVEKEQYNNNNNNIIENNHNEKDENNIATNENDCLIMESNTNTLQNIDYLEAKLCKLNAANSNSNNNWNPMGKMPETTEDFLIALGVDLVSLNKTLPQNAPNDEAAQFSIQSNKNNNNHNNNYESLKITNIENNNSNSSNNNIVTEQNGQAKIILICESNSHPFQTRTILLTPNIECKVGRLIVKSKASESNAIFDCKVLSRNHAVLWFTPEDQKFWVKDTKSSNGTFINDQKLGNEAAPLHFGDVIKFGVDVVENSRKEVHGCIIASVKLYLPDGREAISIDSMHNLRSGYSGEKFVSYDELHRLNSYVQEVSNREKNLKSKLFNIQNILDATRKNSGLCWQALIAEDQLLHRIHMLEKKLQVMEKNVPESSLRNEVNRSLDFRNTSR